MTYLELTRLPNQIAHDTFRLTNKEMAGQFVVTSFQDADTKQYIVMIQSFHLSGYGETKEKAAQMLTESLRDFFSYLKSHPVKQVKKILYEMGWKTDKWHNKQFSNVSVDKDGQLQGLNIVENSFEQYAVTA
ncbi:MAG: hypothetical protein ABJB05_03040 [Parafilimonas sp.]